MISARTFHDDSTLDAISERLRCLENIVKPSRPLVDSERLKALETANEQLHVTVEDLTAEVTDLSTRLERMECLLMCSNLDHVRKIDNLLKKLTKQAVKDPTEHQDEAYFDTCGSLGFEAAAKEPRSLGCYDSGMSTDGILKVWSSNDKSLEPGARMNDNEQPPGYIDELVLPPSQTDITVISTLVDDSACPTFDVNDLLATDRQALQKHGKGGGWNLAAAAAGQKTASLGTRVDQAKPRRFWRDGECNKKNQEERAGIFDSHKPAPVSIDDLEHPHTKMDFGSVSACSKQSAEPIFTATEPLVDQVPPKQGKSRGWDLKAEAAAKGKRIQPKKM